MRWTGRLLALLVLAVVQPLAAAAAERAQPLVVLIEYLSPVVAAFPRDAPIFALYADGTVIFTAPAGSTALFDTPFVATRLTPEGQQKLLAVLAPDSLLALKDTYEGSQRTDQPWNTLHVWVDGVHKDVSVYGEVRTSLGVRAKVPAALLRTLDAIFRFDAPGRPWLPELIEVLLRQEDYSTSTVGVWPEYWPDPSGGQETGSAGERLLLLSGVELARVHAFVAALDYGPAIEIDGRKWMLNFRLPFPGEAAWMQDGQ